MQKVIRDGKVAVLYSPGYGAGWYSWMEDKHKQLLFHPRLVELVEQNKQQDITEELIAEILGIDISEVDYLGGAKNLEIEWIKEGTLFKIDEYDGSESISLRNLEDWIIA